jgi:hypothetical protein
MEKQDNPPTLPTFVGNIRKGNKKGPSFEGTLYLEV